MMNLVKKAYCITSAFFRKVFIINPEHSTGCEQGNTHVSKEEKFRHDFPRVHQNTCVWPLGLEKEVFQPTSPFKLPTLQIPVQI